MLWEYLLERFQVKKMILGREMMWKMRLICIQEIPSLKHFVSFHTILFLALGYKVYIFYHTYVPV